MNSTLRDLGRYGMAFTPSQKFHTGLRSEMYDKGAHGKDIASDFPLPGIANRYQWDISTGTQRDENLGACVACNITQTFK